MKLLGYFVMACLAAAALTANAQVSLIAQLHPGTNYLDSNFSATVRSWQTGATVHFSVTVTPQTSEKVFTRARLIMSDGQSMIEVMPLENHHKQDHLYEFEIASRFLGSSQFTFRYSSSEDFLKQEGGDAIWFFLKDFAPKAAPNAALEPTGVAGSAVAINVTARRWLSFGR